MDSGDLSLRPPARAVTPPALPGGPLASTTGPGTHAGENPFGEPGRARGSKPVRGLRKRIGSVFAGLLALLAKFGAALKALLVALPNFKLLTTAGTALVSVAAYSLFWGWTFAAGFVVLLFVHEMGHVIQLRREGIKASAPMFVPFLGALITAKSLGENALAEARVGLAGPILGSLAAAAVAVAGALTDSSLLLALAYVGFLINLFNLLPVRAARRRAGDGGDGAVDVVPRLRRADRDGVRLPQPDPADHRAVRRHGDVAPLAATPDALARAGRLLPRRAPSPAARRRGLYRPDRGARVRNV